MADDTFVTKEGLQHYTEKVKEKLENKIDTLGNEPGSGQPYHIPYNINPIVQEANKISTTFDTITLDGNKTKTTYPLEIPSADVDNDKAGLYTKALADKKSKVSVSATGTATTSASYITIDGVESKIGGSSDIPVIDLGELSSDVLTQTYSVSKETLTESELQLIADHKCMFKFSFGAGANKKYAYLDDYMTTSGGGNINFSVCLTVPGTTSTISTFTFNLTANTDDGIYGHGTKFDDSRKVVNLGQAVCDPGTTGEAYTLENSTLSETNFFAIFNREVTISFITGGDYQVFTVVDDYSIEEAPSPDDGYVISFLCSLPLPSSTSKREPYKVKGYMVHDADEDKYIITWDGYPISSSSIAVIDNLTSTSTTDALSANMGKKLNDDKFPCDASKDITGDIITLSHSTPYIQTKATNGYLNIIGGSSISKGAYLTLYGTTKSESSLGYGKGMFSLTATHPTSTSNSYHLDGKPDGTLTWGSLNDGKKDIMLEGDVSVATTGSATDGVKYITINGTEHSISGDDSTKLPLTGGTVTGDLGVQGKITLGAYTDNILSTDSVGSLLWKGQVINAGNAIKTFTKIDATRSDLVSFITSITGAVMFHEITFTAAESPNGSNDTVWTAILTKCFTEYYTLQVHQTIKQDDTTTKPRMYMCTANEVDGAMVWSAWQEIITSIGGTMTGPIALKSGDNNGINGINDKSYIRINGATTTANGGSLWLAGKDNSSLAGQFAMQAALNGTYYSLRGYPNGDLTWAGNDISGNLTTGSMTRASDISGAVINRWTKIGRMVFVTFSGRCTVAYAAGQVILSDLPKPQYATAFNFGYYNTNSQGTRMSLTTDGQIKTDTEGLAPDWFAFNFSYISAS